MIRRWERFWFEPVSPEIFGLLRIVLGAAGLISVIGFLPVVMFWSPDGIAPVPGADGFRAFVLSSGFGSWAAWTLFLFLVAAFTCMTIGLFTRWSVAACFIGSVFQSHWNPLPLTSGHTVLVAVLFCIVWADCGSRLSVDAWRRRNRSPLEEGALQPIWPIRLIQVQVAVVYATSGLFKLLGAAWRAGSAVHYTTTQNVYGRIFHVIALPAGLDWLFTLLTYTALFWELAFPLLVLWRRTRMLALVAGVAIHLGIWATMEVGPFTWVMIASYAAFLDPSYVTRLVRRLPSPTLSVGPETKLLSDPDLLGAPRS